MTKSEFDERFEASYAKALESLDISAIQNSDDISEIVRYLFTSQKELLHVLLRELLLSN